MSVILNTSGLNSSILNVIDTATEYLVLISPYQRLHPDVRERLVIAINRGVKVFVIDGKDGMRSEMLDWYSSFPSVSVGYVQELHAKAYANERMAVLGSMNLLEYSQENNEELGVLFRIEEDSTEFEDLSAHIFRIVSEAEEDFGPWNVGIIYSWMPDRRLISSDGGEYIHFCIRCGVMLSHTWNRVYCESCMLSWTRGYDMERVEYGGRCHSCGCFCDPGPSKPLCSDCFFKDPDFARGRVAVMRGISLRRTDLY